MRKLLCRWKSKKIVKIQLRAGGTIIVSALLTPENLFKKLKLFNFKSRIFYHKLILVHLILNIKATTYLKELYCAIINLQSRNL